jgi:hypothetical protein
MSLSAIDSGSTSSRKKLIDMREKSIGSEKENKGDQMQMIRNGEGALGIGQTERPSEVHVLTPGHLSLQISASCPGSAAKKSSSTSLCVLAV